MICSKRNFLRLIFVFLSILIIITAIFPEHLNALDEANYQDLEQKIAKGYSDKFCNAVGIGLSIDSATKIAIKENENARFNSRLWREIFSSGEKNISKLDTESLNVSIAENIISRCGNAISMTGTQGVNEYLDILERVRNSEEVS
tara:strand:- start:35 stop:469 length:435 start_codon:yes stop_codon:yes gene_type:complete